MGKLSAVTIKALSSPGRYGDGDGLFLLISRSGTKSWMARIQKDGKRRDHGLGSLSKVTLAQAREKARELRSQVQAGLDPNTERQKAANTPRFCEAAALVHYEHSPGWKNAKHGKQWLSSLKNHAFPTLGNISVAEIQAPAVRDTLARIWLSHPETARRVRQRIIAIIDWAVAKGYRDAPLAVAIIDKALPKQRAKPKHHRSLPYDQMPAFMEHLREGASLGRLALEAIILTAARSGEVRGMVWSELDLENALWSIPASRMKAGRDHVVPLSPQAVSLLQSMKALSPVSAYVTE